MKRIVSLLLITLLSTLVFAGDKLKAEWNTGKVVSFGTENYTTSSGTTTTGRVDSYGNINATSSQTNWNHNLYRVVLDGGEYTYFAVRVLSWRWQHDPKITENAEIKWRIEIEKETLFLLDDEDKEFKMKLTKRRKNDGAN